MPISLETIYKEIARELFAEFPDAHWGPGHVVLEDGNWDAYQPAIDLALLVLAYRALTAAGYTDTADNLIVAAKWQDLQIAERAEWYADHSIAELGATLSALELIRWHEEGHQGDAPKE